MANNPAQIDDSIANHLTALIQEGNDPRLVLSAVLSNAAGIANMILKAEKANPAGIATQYAISLSEALLPEATEEKPAERPAIIIAPANALPR